MLEVFCTRSFQTLVASVRRQHFLAHWTPGVFHVLRSSLSHRAGCGVRPIQLGWWMRADSAIAKRACGLNIGAEDPKGWSKVQAILDFEERHFSQRERGLQRITLERDMCTTHKQALFTQPLRNVTCGTWCAVVLTQICRWTCSFDVSLVAHLVGLPIGSPLNTLKGVARKSEFKKVLSVNTGADAEQSMNRFNFDFGKVLPRPSGIEFSWVLWVRRCGPLLGGVAASSSVEICVSAVEASEVRGTGSHRVPGRLFSLTK